MIPAVGQTLDGPSGADTIRLDTPLGAGAFGFVFAATDLTSNETIAVKFPHISVLGSDDLLAFSNEVQAAEEINHPNVVKILYTQADFSRANPPYLLMKYVDGGTLKQHLDALSDRKALLTIEELQLWMNQLIDGMEAINARLLHRDLKPDNILIDNDTLKIADFGLSKIVGATTRTRTFKGGQHILYMAPEGWKSETNTIQLDMYALGIVFFEMITLEFPYDIPKSIRSLDLDAVKDMHLFQAPKRARGLRPDVPTAVDHVIQRMLAKRAEERFDDWNAIRRALANAWGTPSGQQNSNVDPVTQQVLEEVSLLHQQKATEKAAQGHLAKIREEELKVDRHQIDKLLNSIRQWVDVYNEQSSLGSITIRLGGTPTDPWQHFFDIPDTGSIQLSFRRLAPPVELTRGSVRVFAYLADQDGVGFNYLLIRKNEDDIYGEWQICTVGHSPLVNPNKPRRAAEAFGFETGREFREEMCFSEHTMHIYTYEFAQAEPTHFAEIVRDLIKRRRTNQNQL